MFLRSFPNRALANAYVVWHVAGERRLPFTPLEKLVAIQNRRVRAIVRHAYKTVPFYREVMDARGLRPRDFSAAEDLERLPLLTGEELADDPDRFVSTKYRPGSGVAIHTSGTTGKAKVIHWDSAAMYRALAHTYRHRLVLAPLVGGTTGYREAVPARIGAIHDEVRAFYESHLWVPGGIDLKRCHIDAEQPLRQVTAELDAFRPDVVLGYGVFLGAMFRWIALNRPDCHRPKAVVYGAEEMTEAHRLTIEDDLGIPVFSNYEAAEALRIAFQCERREGFHLSMDLVALRVVDDSGATAPDGESGEIVLSNLMNRATVLLNYAIGDRASLSTAPCPCGRTLPTIERLEGRSHDCLVLPHGRLAVSGGVLKRLLEVGGMSQVQVEQEELCRFVVRAVDLPGSDRSAAAAGLERALEDLMERPVELTVEWCESIPPGPSGKVRAVISHCLDAALAADPRVTHG